MNGRTGRKSASTSPTTHKSPSPSPKQHQQLNKQPKRKLSTIQSGPLHSSITAPSPAPQSSSFLPSFHLSPLSTTSAANKLLTNSQRLYSQSTSISQHYNTPTTGQSSDPQRLDDDGASGQHHHKPHQKRHKQKFERSDGLSALLSTLAFSYLARTSANELPTSLIATDLEMASKTPLSTAQQVETETTHHTTNPLSDFKESTKKQRQRKKGAKPAPSSALDFSKIDRSKDTNALRSIVVSADAVKKTIHNRYLHFGLNPRGATDLEKTFATAIADTDNESHMPFFKKKFNEVQDALDLNRDVLHEDANPLLAHHKQLEDLNLQHELSSYAVNDDDQVDGDGDKDEIDPVDAQGSPTQSTTSTTRLRKSKKGTIGAKKHVLPGLADLQKSIFAELDDIVEFANLHYDSVLKALSQHSLSALYPPELLTVEFFDYRLELFNDAIREDLGALYRSKYHFYSKHLKKCLDNGELSQDEYDYHSNHISQLFEPTYPNLNDIQAAFAKIPYSADDVNIKDMYSDEALGFTSTDTTFIRNHQNSLEEELRLVEAVKSSLTEHIFSIKQFKQSLNIAAHRYPGLNVPIELYISQLNYEHQSISKAVDEYNELTEQMTKMGRASNLSPLQEHVLRWFKPLAESIDKEVQQCRDKLLNPVASKKKPRFDDNGDEIALSPAALAAQQEEAASAAKFQDLKLILPYINELKSTELGCIALHETLSRIINAPSGMRVIDLSLAIGRIVNTEANLQRLRQDRANFQRLRRYYPGAKLNEQVIRRAMTNQSKKDSSSKSDLNPISTGLDMYGHASTEDNVIWSDLIQAKIGSFLIKHMLQSSNIRQILDAATGKYITTKTQLVPASNNDGGAPNETHVPGFVYEHRQVGQSFVGFITCHPDVHNVLNHAHTDVHALAVRLLPMVIPPRPWRGVRDGGYLSVPSSIIRSKGSRKQVQAVDASDIRQVHDSLNFLGRVAWSINPFVLSVIERAWVEGGGFAAMPSRRDIPQPPQPTLNLLQWDQQRGRYFVPSAANNQQRGVNPEQLAQQTTQWRQWQRDQQRISQYNADLHSLRCDLTLRLNQARQLADSPVYFPLNMDFRGRAYPIPPHLNHLGADLARALLLFHQKKPLGPKGLYWLKAHLAAQFGVDKVSFDDRVKFIEQNLQLVRDTALNPMHPNVPNPHYGKLRALDEPLYPIPREIQEKYARVYIRQQLDKIKDEAGKKKKMQLLLADYDKQGLSIDMSIEDDPEECVHPLDGERDVRAKLPWWQTADNPWQALSTCHAIISAIDSGNPEAYETGLPVHQDGSCNGLQHYAALGRDFQGGSRVNLTKSDKPQDVYSHVLNEVKRRMEQDIKDTDNPLAKMLLPFMQRKVVKQTVMTSVYGVTFIGARDQILKQLRDLKDIPWDEASKLVMEQQIENKKKFLKKQGESEQRRLQRERTKLLQGMNEQERVEFLNQEMMEQTLSQDLQEGMDPLFEEQSMEDLSHDPLTTPPSERIQEGGRPNTPSAQAQNSTSSEDTANALLMSQRQAQEAAMRASSIYLARLTLTSLGTVFSAATRIMSWLTECAGIISKQEQPVSWITPMQLPVVQHYRLISKYQVKTLNQTVTLHHDNDDLPVSPQRQRAAFPPNFVHSLDATHMMLTATQCAQRGLVFSSVHDSYWTHPGDVDKMNALLRDRFIHLYSGPILEDLRESFVLRYPTAEFPALPERGDLDLEEVRKSPYFFN